MARQQAHNTIDFLNDGLDAKTEYRFYEKNGYLYIWFYVSGNRRQKACSLAYREALDTAYRAEARQVAQSIVASERTGRVLVPSEDERVLVANTLEELVEAWKKLQVEKYPASYKTRQIQIDNVRNVVTACAPELDVTPLQCIVDDRGPQMFLDARMRERSKETVKKEVGIMFDFLKWLHETKRFITVVPKRPVYRKKDLGVRIGPQRAAPVHLSDEIALRIINELPEYAARGGRHSEDTKRPDNAFVLRDWMRFSFEVSLRPSTVGRLEVGRHWIRGDRFLTVTPDIDKGGNAALGNKPRRVPLTRVAFDILMKHAPGQGLIFGQHDIRVQWKRAAIKILGPERGQECAPYDLRHGANFRMRSTVGGSVGGAMHMTGHALATTNDGYMVGSEEEAKEVVALLDKRNAELEKKLRPGRRSASRGRRRPS